MTGSAKTLEFGKAVLTAVPKGKSLAMPFIKVSKVKLTSLVFTAPSAIKDVNGWVNLETLKLIEHR